MTKAKATMSINPKIGEDDSTSPNSYYKGESSNRIPEAGLNNTDRPTKPIEEIKPTKATSKRSGQVQRPTKF